MSGVFRYANPSLIRWGPGSLAGLGQDLERLGAARPFLLSNRSVLANRALMDSLETALGDRALVGRARISQHAPIEDVEAAAAEARRAGADSLVSLGGGSAIDAAKLVGLRLADDTGVPPPHVAIPCTLSAAELASGAGFTDEAGNKVGARDARGLPALVVYDAEVALHTPIDLWTSTGIRALDHAVETILAEGEHPLADVLAAEAMRRLRQSLPEARRRPRDAGVRTENQLAAWFSFTLPGPAAGGLSHVMGKAIGARHGIPHGVTSCLLLPHVMRYRAPRDAERAARLPYGADEVAALVGELGLPQHLAAFGLGEEELRAAAQAVGGPHPPEEILEIYLQAM